MSLSSQARAKAVAPVARTTASRPRVAPIVAFSEYAVASMHCSTAVTGHRPCSRPPTSQGSCRQACNPVQAVHDAVCCNNDGLLKKLLPSHTAAAGDDKRSAQKGSNKVLGSSSRAGKKQPLVQPLGRAPTNPKENAESVLWFVLVGGFFLTGVPVSGATQCHNDTAVVLSALLRKPRACFSGADSTGLTSPTPWEPPVRQARMDACQPLSDCQQLC